MQRVGNKAKGTQRVGSRAQVMHGNAKQTGGGLKKKDLKYNKQGKIVSKKMSTMAKKEKRLQKAGYTTKKGQFGAVRIDSKKMMKGGGAFVVSVSNVDYNTDGIREVRDFVNPYEPHNVQDGRILNIKITLTPRKKKIQ